MGVPVSRDPFRGAIPDDRLYDPATDMWVMTTGDEVVIGATGYGIHLAGEIIGFTAKPKGAQTARGRSLGTVECAKTVIALRSPVSLLLTAANEALEERAAPVNLDPYGVGWMVRGRPLDWAGELGFLVDGAAYRAHLRALDPEAVIL
jgi:glycine cleavage system H protein